MRYAPFVKIIEVGDNHVLGEIIPENKIENYKKIKGILHWVGSDDSVQIETWNYERPFNKAIPGKDQNFLLDFNNESKKVIKNSRIPKGLV